MVGSFYDPDLDEGCAFEELISFHGGLGGPQTQAFVLHPARLAMPHEPLVGAASVHELLRGWRAELHPAAPASGGERPRSGGGAGAHFGTRARDRRRVSHMSTTEPAATPAAPAPAGPSSARIITARVLVVLGVVLVVVSLLANFVRREALDRDTFRDTSQQLIANDDIRNQVAATMVDQLYANVDVAGALQQRLPDNLQPLAAPLAGLAREAIDRGAQELLARPRVQSLFVDASSLAQAQVKRVLEGETPRLQTSNGNVVLDLRPLVVQLGDRFGFLGDLDQQLPPNAAQVTLLKADNLGTAQSVTQGLKVVANWIWIPAILAGRSHCGSCRVAAAARCARSGSA